ncbi:MAG: hypothetical protein ACJATA_000497 [Sphingobacteriales bacterium]|jgi:hypothetical protein
MSIPMKNIFLITIITISSFFAFGQNTDKNFTLKADASIEGDFVQVKVFLKNNQSDKESLGNMNVRIRIGQEVSSLDIVNTSLIPGTEFSSFNGYERAIAGYNKKKSIVTLNIYRDVENGEGIELSEEYILLGILQVPFKNFDPNLKLTWDLGNGDFSSFSGRSIRKEEIEALPIELFKTATSTKSIIANNLQVKLFPNPIISNATLEVQGLKNDKSRVEIFAVTGQKIAEYSLTNLFSTNSVYIETSNLNPGQYIIRILDGNEMKQINCIKL